MQKPSLGRIVLVTVDPATNNGVDHAPAVIVRAWSDNLVNVHVLPDRSGPYWLSSVPLHADRAEVDAAHAAKREQFVAAGHEPDGIRPFNGAYWPPRV